MKLALAMIVKGTDEEAEHLKTCLESIAPHVDEVFITLTQENEYVRDVCDFYDCEVSFYEWDDHFANARNYSFEQVPDDYDYIMWLDADDVVENAKELKDIVAKRKKDAYSLWYLYALDENNDPVVVHRKTQIVKNDGSFEWKGRLHEDLMTDRQVSYDHIEDVRRVHMSEEDRFGRAKERNLRIAEKQLEEEPEDARALWNLANSQKAIGNLEDAIDSFSEFIEKTGSEKEKYIALNRKAECQSALDKNQEADDTFRKAIGLEPEYPDAYIGLGKHLFHKDKYVQARKMLKAGLKKEPPYMELIVYNPREYDLEPLRYLALTYVQLNQMQLAHQCFKSCLEITPNNDNLRQLVEDFDKKAEEEKDVHEHLQKLSDVEDKEELKEKLDEIPAEFQSHPMVCRIRNKHFVKEESSGKDIVYYCGDSSEVWTPKTAEESGIGGSEEAVINLTKRWADMGYNVTVYNKCGHEVQEFDGVTYKPFWMFNAKDKQDVAIMWRMPAFTQADVNADTVLLDMHDTIPSAEFTEGRLENIDQIMVKSNFHRSLYENISDDKFTVVPNGITPEDFDATKEKEDKLLINTSSPDRSLTALLKGFELVREEVPEAKLKWAYGWNVFDSSTTDENKLAWKEEMQQKLEEAENVEALGRISHGEVAELYESAEIFAYPTEFAEIDCISITKAMAAGAVPVTTDFAALGEKMGYGGAFIQSDKDKTNWTEPGKFDFSLEDEKKIEAWADAVIEQLEDKKVSVNSEKVKEDYSWDTIADEWAELFS